MNGSQSFQDPTASALLALGLALLASMARTRGTLDKAKAEQAHSTKPPYSPYAGRDFPTRPLLRRHASAHGVLVGRRRFRVPARSARRLSLRQGRGGDLVDGQPVKLSRPLDFLVVADHSDNMGFFPQLFAGDPKMLADATGRRWYDMIQSGKGAEAAIEIIVELLARAHFRRTSCRCPARPPTARAWQQTIAAAEALNDPGRFTAFIGYEWTSNTGGNNLHRNVIFRDNGDKASRVEPYTTVKPLGSDNPRDLWKWMAAYEEKTGGRVLAIAHNGNLSTASCSRWSSRSPESRSTASTPRRAPVGAALRSHPDQGRRRGAPVPLAQRRVRRLRALGQGQPRPERAEEAGDAPVRVRPLGAEERAQARAGASAPTPTSSA